MRGFRGNYILVAVVAAMLCTTATAAIANGGLATWYTLYGGISGSFGVSCLIMALFLCIVVEGLVFRIFRLFPSPFKVSLIVNTASLIVGFFIQHILISIVVTIVLESVLLFGIISVQFSRSAAGWYETCKCPRLACFVIAPILNLVTGFGLLCLLGIANEYAYEITPRSRNRNACINNLRQIDGAKDQYVLEYGVPPKYGTNHHLYTPRWENLAIYIKDVTNRSCPGASIGQHNCIDSYRINPIGSNPECLFWPGEHLLTNR